MYAFMNESTELEDLNANMAVGWQGTENRGKVGKVVSMRLIFQTERGENPKLGKEYCCEVCLASNTVLHYHDFPSALTQGFAGNFSRVKISKPVQTKARALRAPSLNGTSNNTFSRKIVEKPYFYILYRPFFLEPSEFFSQSPRRASQVTLQGRG